LVKQPEIEVKFFGYSLRQTHTLKNWLHDHNLDGHSATILKLPPTLLSALWYKTGFPNIEMLAPHSQVFHAWEELVPPTRQTAVVSTIHDLSVLKFPETVHPSTLYKHTQAFKRLKKTNRHVIAVSKSTYQDIIELLEFPKERVHLVYEALPRESKIELTKEESQAVLKKLKLDKPYILFVGTPEPRKNLDMLVQAWGKLKSEFDIVVVGSKGWDHIEENLSANGVRRFTNLSSASVAALYKHATVFAYPSLYEGFGLPILEAYYHQVPVLTSNRGAMAEIAGNAAELIDPDSLEDIEHGLKKLIEESAEKKSRRLQAMKLRLQIFRWSTSAEKTVQVYQSAIKDVT